MTVQQNPSVFIFTPYTCDDEEKRTSTKTLATCVSDTISITLHNPQLVPLLLTLVILLTIRWIKVEVRCHFPQRKVVQMRLPIIDATSTGQVLDIVNKHRPCSFNDNRSCMNTMKSRASDMEPRGTILGTLAKHSKVVLTRTLKLLQDRLTSIKRSMFSLSRQSWCLYMRNMCDTESKSTKCVAKFSVIFKLVTHGLSFAESWCAVTTMCEWS